MQDPRFIHLETIDQILRYLKYAPGKGLHFSNNGYVKIEGFIDTDWTGSLDGRR